MNKIRLNADDKNRLAELINAYVNPQTPFKINSKGEVSMNKNSWLIRKFRNESDNSLDFLEVSQLILDQIMKEKEGIPFVVQLCRTGLGALVNSNDRSETIKKMYTAHLITEQPDSVQRQQSQQRGPIGQDVTVQTRTKQVPQVQQIMRTPFSRSKDLAEDVATLMNNADRVIIYDERQ